MLAALGTVNTIHHLRAALLSRCGVHAALQRRIQYGGYHDSALAEWGGPAASTACSLPDGAHADRRHVSWPHSLALTPGMYFAWYFKESFPFLKLSLKMLHVLGSYSGLAMPTVLAFKLSGERGPA